MNRWEQEFQHLTLEEQKKVLEAIRSTYEQAAIDCQNRIAQLNARTDMQNLQSIIYRRQYQEAILNQINETLADLNATNYETIHDYVEQCYVNGYIGAMYDLSQQGIPIITPIDQRDVFRATVTDSRLSEGLYSALGEDVNELKDAVRRELSRGIVQGSSWVDVARNLSTHMVNSPFRTAMNNSMRIARTEGHRVQMQGSMDALHVAKDKGADVLKQWDAALDANTRTSHQHVDGEIREVDEKFSNGLMFPSDPKGSAAEVINCRCALLHRARWGLDEDELKTLQKRAEYFGLDKTDNFNDFKKKYLGITDDSSIVSNDMTKYNTYEEAIKGLTEDIGFDVVEDSFKKVDKELAVENINQLKKLEDKFGAIHNSDKTDICSISNKNAYAYVGSTLTNRSRQTLSLCPRNYRNRDNFMKSILHDRDVGWSMPFADGFERIYTITHEYGHILQNILVRDRMIENGWSSDNPMQFVNRQRSTTKAMFRWYYDLTNAVERECRQEIIAIARERNENFVLNDNLSRYGRTNRAEFFAEVFANSQCGKPNELGDAMNVWLERRGLIR